MYIYVYIYIYICSPRGLSSGLLAMGVLTDAALLLPSVVGGSGEFCSSSSCRAKKENINPVAAVELARVVESYLAHENPSPSLGLP